MSSSEDSDIGSSVETLKGPTWSSGSSHTITTTEEDETFKYHPDTSLVGELGHATDLGKLAGATFNHCAIPIRSKALHIEDVDTEATTITEETPENEVKAKGLDSQNSDTVNNLDDLSELSGHDEDEYVLSDEHDDIFRFSWPNEESEFLLDDSDPYPLTTMYARSAPRNSVRYGCCATSKCGVKISDMPLPPTTFQAEQEKPGQQINNGDDHDGMKPTSSTNPIPLASFLQLVGEGHTGSSKGINHGQEASSSGVNRKWGKQSSHNPAPVGPHATLLSYWKFPNAMIPPHLRKAFDSETDSSDTVGPKDGRAGDNRID